MTVTVEVLRDDNDAELASFLDSLGAKSTVVLGYHYPFYRDMLAIIGVGEPLYLAARHNGVLEGYLPVFAKKAQAGTVLSSLPYFGPNGGVLCDGECREEIHTALLEKAAHYASKARALACSIYTPFQFADFELYDRTLAEWTAVERFTQYQLLAEDNRDPAVGRNLRKAQRLGVEVSCDITPVRLRAFYAIYEENCAEFGIPLKPWACVEYLTRPELLGKHTRLYLAIHEGKVLAGLMMIWSPLVASYYIPCSLSEARNFQPSTAVIDFAMREAHERGMKFWNWESSPGRDSGVYQFKKKWGAVEGEYRIYVESFDGKDKIRGLGREAIAREFPYFYLWPFDRL